TSNITMVRALDFPRAVLPLSVALSEMLTLLPAIGVMIVIVLLTGEPITVSWLLLPVALVLILLFSAGCAMIAARVVVAARDLRNLIPVAIRLLRYVSGVFFSIEAYAGRFEWGFVLEYQPVAVYLTLMRSVLLQDVAVDPTMWLTGLAWAVVLFLVGFVVFWSAEGKYGRDCRRLRGDRLRGRRRPRRRRARACEAGRRRGADPVGHRRRRPRALPGLRWPQARVRPGDGPHPRDVQPQPPSRRRGDRGARGARRVVRRPPRRVDRDHRAQRCRQEHPAARHRGSDADELGGRLRGGDQLAAGRQRRARQLAHRRAQRHDRRARARADAGAGAGAVRRH